MHRLAYCSFALFAAACATDAQIETAAPDEVIDGPLGFDHPRPPDEDGGLRFSVGFSHPVCERRVVEFEVFNTTRPDGSTVPLPTCEWMFSGGVTATGCVGQAELPVSGTVNYSVRVTDPETSTTTEMRGNTVVYEPLAVEVRAEAPECGLQFTVSTAKNQPAFSRADISPADSVVGDPFLFGEVTEQVIEVTAPGTYTISYFAEDERTTGGICIAREEITVEVKECPQPPPCEAVDAAAAQ